MDGRRFSGACSSCKLGWEPSSRGAKRGDAGTSRGRNVPFLSLVCLRLLLPAFPRVEAQMGPNGDPVFPSEDTAATTQAQAEDFRHGLEGEFRRKPPPGWSLQQRL